MTRTIKLPFGKTSRRALMVPVLTLYFMASGLSEAEASRLALVVGNSDYTGVTPLRNAARDANDIAGALERLGFEVTLLTDVAGATFWDKVDAFSLKAETAESVVFFYSGHAFQMNGANYLVPVDAQLTSREAIRTETWNLDGIIARLQDRKRQTLIFLDACRNDPLPQSVRGTGSAADGLARLQTGVGTFVAFATEPGAVTYDGAGEAPNSPFTTALLENIETPGISVSDMMINVRNEVEERTFRRQTPWDQSSLREQFYFNPAAETKQELSEADYELLAQLAPDDRKKFLDLLRASGFSESSLRQADTAIEVASLGLEMAADDGGVTLGDAPVGPAAEAEQAPEPEVIDLASLETVDGGGTVVSAPVAAAPEVATPAPPAEPVQVATAPAAEPAAPVTSTSIDSVQETTVALLPQPTETMQQPLGADNGEEPPVRLAALSWETRGIIGINAVTVERLRVMGQPLSPEVESHRPILAAIDPALLEEQDDPAAETLSGRELASAAQSELKRVGCYQLTVDGAWGRGSRTALTSYFLAKRQVPDSLEPTPELISQLKLESSVVCAVRVSSVAASVRAKAVTQVAEREEAEGARRVNKSTGRVINTPKVVKKEMKKGLLSPGGF
jgi:hypothetical protein